MKIELINEVLGDARQAAEDTQQLAADVKQSAQLRWRLLCAEFAVFKLGLGRLAVLVPALLLLSLLAAMSLSVTIGYLMYLVTGSPLAGIVLVLVLHAALIAFAAMRALVTVRAMDFARSRSHLLRLSRHVME